jgi:hypothetical protein
MHVHRERKIEEEITRVKEILRNKLIEKKTERKI